MKPPITIDRKDLKKPDEFIQKGQSALTFLAERRNLFWGLLVAIIFVTATYYFLDWRNSKTLQKGWTAFNETMKLPEAERWEKLKSVYQSELPHRPALLAAITLGDHFFDLARKDALDKKNPLTALQASEWYGKALEIKGLLPTEKQLILVNRGQSFELADQLDTAMKDYQTSISEASGEAKAWAMINLGRAQELKKNQADAMKTYERVSTEFANSEYAKLAKSYLRRLKSPLLQTGT